MTHPGSNCLFLGLTRSSANMATFRGAFDKIARRSGIVPRPNRAELSLEFDNGSKIYVMGADSNEEQRERLLGGAYQLVIIDECASFTTDLNDLVFNLRPASAGVDGTICMIGTPGNVKNFFFRATTGEHDKEDVQGWSVHRWTFHDEPHRGHLQEKARLELVAANPLVVETPRYKQWYLGEWAIDESALVYRYDEGRNVIDDLPVLPRNEGWNYGLSVDWGFNDETALVVVAWSDHDPSLYVVSVTKESNLAPSVVYEKIMDRVAHYEPLWTVVDTGGLGRMLAEDLSYKLGISWRTAQRRDKYQAICMLNDDLTMGKIKVVLPQGEGLIDEWDALIWDPRTVARGPREVLTGRDMPDHASDAFLYAWREATNHTATERPRTLVRGSAEWMDAEFDRMIEREQARANMDWFERGLDGTE